MGDTPGRRRKVQEKFLIGSCKIGPESFGGFEMKRLFADVIEFRDGAFFDLGRRLPGEIAGFELLPHLAESCA